MQKSCQILNDYKESLDELENFDKIKNVSIRVSTILVSKDISNNLNKNELNS